MEFSPHNAIVQRCLQGMAMEDSNQAEAALELFLRAWNEAEHDFERFISAYYVARHQAHVADRLRWLERALQWAQEIDDDSVTSAYPGLYTKIAQGYEELGDADAAERYHELASVFQARPAATGPFYHGTRADLEVGDLLIAGGDSNYKPRLKMNHVYFTALLDGAGLAAALAKGEGDERVYIVEPTGVFENDPNVTDKKFPGNPTRSYRSTEPLKVVGEAGDWLRQRPEQLQQWRERLAKNTGEIIN